MAGAIPHSGFFYPYKDQFLHLHHFPLQEPKGPDLPFPGDFDDDRGETHERTIDVHRSDPRKGDGGLRAAEQAEVFDGHAKFIDMIRSGKTQLPMSGQ